MNSEHGLSAPTTTRQSVEVEIAENDVRGIAVHIASRVAGLAKTDDVIVSRTVKDLVAGSGLSFEDYGTHRLKGIPDAWQLYRVAVT